MIKITSPHACTPAATHFGSSTHFSTPYAFAPSHFPIAPCIIHLPHEPSSRQPRPVRGTGYPCLPYVVACYRTRTGPAPAETSAGFSRHTPASPVAGTEQRTPPTTRQALLTYSHAKCLSSRLTVMSGHWRHGVQSSTQGRGAARRLRIGPKTGPGTAARLEVGNCGERFANLFQAHAVFSHYACADGSAFFCRRLPRAGLSG